MTFGISIFYIINRLYNLIDSFKALVMKWGVADDAGEGGGADGSEWCSGWSTKTRSDLFLIIGDRGAGIWNLGLHVATYM